MAEGAVLIDSSALDIQGVIDKVLAVVSPPGR
jgi:cytidylate kinase